MKRSGLCTLLFCAAAQAQTPLPLPAGYPTLLGASCGGVHLASYVTGFNADGNITGEVYAWTSCGGSGRGGGYKSTIYQSWHSIVWDFKLGYKVLPYDSIQPDPAYTAADAWGNTVLDTCVGTTNGQPACVAKAIIVYAAPTPAVSATVPPLLGLGSAQALAALQAAGLVETPYKLATPYYARNTVCGQSPAAGTVVDPGSSVSVCISTGAPKND